MSGISRVASSLVAEEEILHQQFADNARRATDARFVNFSRYDPVTRRVQVRGTSSRETAFMQRGIDAVRRTFPGWDPDQVGFQADVNPSVGAVFLERKSVHVPIAKAAEGCVPAFMLQIGQALVGLRWCFSCPVVVQGEVAGSLALCGPEPFTETQTRTCEAFAHQAALTLENARLLRTVRASLDELRRSRRLISAAEDHQRREIAELLHSRVQTNLLIVYHKLGQAQERFPDAPSELLGLVGDARSEIDRIREEEVRRASHLLHPSVIRLGLGPALRSLVKAFEGRLQIEIAEDAAFRSADDTDAARIAEPVRLAAYRVVEEALGNVVRHAGADRVRITLSVADDRLRVEVADDGVGFDPTRPPEGLGVRTIASRVESVGGEWRIESAPGKGTRVHCGLPLS